MCFFPFFSFKKYCKENLRMGVVNGAINFLLKNIIGRIKGCVSYSIIFVKIHSKNECRTFIGLFQSFTIPVRFPSISCHFSSISGRFPVIYGYFLAISRSFPVFSINLRSFPGQQKSRLDSPYYWY